jgi:hypothetical protein
MDPSEDSSPVNNTGPSLASLPIDILSLLPEFLHNIEDYINLGSTCHSLRAALSLAHPRIILQLAAASSRIFFRPSPHFLVAAKARELADWAAKDPRNAVLLREAMQENGVDGLMELCLKHTNGLTMQRIRELHAMRFAVINPIVDLIDKCVGQQWYDTPNFWNGGVDDAWTIDVDPPETFFHLAIYGGLVAREFDAYISQIQRGRVDTEQITKDGAMDVDNRLEYVKYCIPDPDCYQCMSTAQNVMRQDGTMDPRRKVNTTGPYFMYRQQMGIGFPTEIRMHGSQVGLGHLLRSERWRTAWEDVLTTDSGNSLLVPGDWKYDMFESIVLCQGLEGMEMLTTAGREKWRGRVAIWREQIARIDIAPPKKVQVGTQRTYPFPWLRGDIAITTSGYVLGT